MSSGSLSYRARRRPSVRPLALSVTIAALAFPGVARAQHLLTAFGIGGPTFESVVPIVDVFRTHVGGGSVAGANGSFGGVRREINWDGVPDAFASPNNLPADFFNVNSPRGIVLSTPGTGFRVSATASGSTPPEFGELDPAYPTQFAPFSGQRLFTTLGSNVLDVQFFMPGTTTRAATRAFGAVFSDVDLLNATTMSFFGLDDQLLFSAPVPISGGAEGFSFFAVAFQTELIGRVRIVAGDQAATSTGTGDVVVLDDFIYGEVVPVAAAVVPEPATFALTGGGLALLAVAGRRRRRG